MKKPNTIGSAATAVLAAALMTTTSAMLAPQAHASTDPFYEYSGQQPLSEITPGTVLATRTVPYHLSGVATPLTAVQLLYRTTDAQQRPSVNVTSVLIPPGADPAEAVAYQSAYDSLDPDDGPSRAIAGTATPTGALVNTTDGAFVSQFLAQRRAVIVADVEGPRATLGTGPEYGRATLDSIRAATRSTATGLSPDTRIGLFGYSGGGIATTWASALAPTYAPDIDQRLVGAAAGGVMVDFPRTVHYIDGSGFWAGVMVPTVIGLARAYDIDLTPYLSDYGAQLLTQLDNASINDALGHYPGLKWEQLAKPEYRDPDSIPSLAEATRQADLELAPTPTTPMFIGQGTDGTLEGTDNTKPGIGPGDGVMIAGDVRTLARRYCDTGNHAITYRQYGALSHVTALPVWSVDAFSWLNDRFAAVPAPTNCTEIAPENPHTDGN
ncbi:lipase family protein [Nocardia sp. NPDC101769]|uniref:lipase family protein n=1 Tax=Nocardia sp. NPDC101769 TaxID=3364333 RepID=UPI0038178636